MTVAEFTGDLISSLGMVLSARMNIRVLRAEERWNNVVASANRLVVGWSGVQIPAGVRDFNVLQKDQTGSGTHPPIQWVLGCDGDH